jgi:hypothetical protein
MTTMMILLVIDTALVAALSVAVVALLFALWSANDRRED